MLLLLVLACVPQAPSSPEQCESWLGTDAQRSNCRTRHALDLFETDAKAGESYVEERVPRQVERDYIYWQVASRVQDSAKYCDRIKSTKIYKDKCLERVQRPHLNSALQGSRPADPGRPPPESREP